MLLACIPSYHDFHWALLTQLSPLTCRALGRRRMVAMFPTGLPLSSDSSVLKDGSFKVQIPQTSRLYYRHEAEFRTLCALRWREDKWISVPPRPAKPVLPLRLPFTAPPVFTSSLVQCLFCVGCTNTFWLQGATLWWGDTDTKYSFDTR